MDLRAAYHRWLFGETFIDLCRLLVDPAGVAGRDDLDWPYLVQLSSQHLVTTALAHAVRDADGPPVPDDVRDFLSSIERLNALRNACAVKETRDLVAGLNRAGIRPLLLKGIAGLMNDLYPAPSWRLLADIDILVDGTDRGGAERVLAALGYRRLPVEGEVAREDHHHGAPWIHPSRRFEVELHRSVLNPRCGAILAVRDAFAEARSGSGDGIDYALLAPTHSMIHLVAHAQLQNRYHALKLFELRALLDAVRLEARFGKDIDPGRVARAFASVGAGQALEHFARLAATLLDCRLAGTGGSAPSVFLDELATGLWMNHDGVRPLLLAAARLRALPRLPARLVDRRWYAAKWRFWHLDRTERRRAVHGIRARAVHSRATRGSPRQGRPV